MNRAVLSIAYPDARQAGEAARSLAPDGEGFADFWTEGKTLVVEARSEGAMGLLRSLDDVMACLRSLEGADVGPRKT